MSQINTYEAKRDLSDLLDRVQKGETVVIARHNKPIAELRPVRSRPKRARPAGLCAGEVTVSPDFNETLPDDVLADFLPS
jgi:prevent-host-death family protein